ncbi:DUF4115 domain-containing protein [Niveibacterium sp. 24ML]|uniref:RodZ domain-containing protein n=1 Tax=Niveibacterium sp. 24ML TaxID=2985512 RepID=UPI00226FD800|nr:RodZ domain-containing protein [Niveibacterium sp. 24ML]MCX9155092.1 DUF4115 domain-containing protein [Niveibacterium sp. 24ML]
MESTTYATEPGVAASGAALRQAREARGLGLAEVATTLKLTTRQIEAIEDEAFEVLPGNAFARGFVRNYARFLSLDPAPLLERMAQPARAEELRLAPESNAEGAVPRSPSGYRSTSAMPAVLLFGAILVLGGLGYLFDWYGRQSPVLIDQAALQSMPAVASSEAVFPPKSEETEVVMAQVEAVATASAPALQAPASEPLPAQSAALVTADAPAPQPMQSAPATPEAPQAGISFSFSQDAWVEVRDASGRVVFSQLNKAGSTQAVQGKAPFSLVIGNATNVKLSYNGQPIDLTPHTKVSVARLSLK